ncbi:MAG TPA: SPFH domain-containing protein [Chloroflexota bacterium]|nr:SPFH domain-containing protein [Chloroflexota bacterium]
MSKKKKNKRQRPELGLLGFVLAAFGLAVMAYFLSDRRGHPYGATLSFIWLYVTGVTFALGVLFFAQFAAPMRSRLGWWEGVRLIMRHYTGLSRQYLRQPRTDDKKRQPSAAVVPRADIPQSLFTMRAGIVRSYQALAITKGNSFIRTAGPGFVDLYDKEEIRQVIDLRMQLRQQPVHASTRDGIPLETSVTVIFRVQQDPEDRTQAHLLFPFDKEAIFLISYLHTVNLEGTSYGWAEQLTPRAAALLTRELAQYNLDALIHYPSTAVSPLQEINRRILQTLQGQPELRGIQIMAAKAGPLKLPEEIQKQNIATWQAEWQRKIEVEKAVVDAEVIRRMKQARARAQIEIIETIIQNLEVMRQEGESELYQVIILRLIDALEEAIAADSPRALVPHRIMAGLLADASAQMQARLDDPLLPSGPDGGGSRP